LLRYNFFTRGIGSFEFVPSRAAPDIRAIGDVPKQHETERDVLVLTRLLVTLKLVRSLPKSLLKSLGRLRLLDTCRGG